MVEIVKHHGAALELLTPVHADSRGYFGESWKSSWNSVGLDFTVAQTNICWTEHRHTLRGMHAQYGSASVAKLVRVIKGEILDVFVDAREGSIAYGDWTGVHLHQPGQAVYVPRGFYHGYVTLTDDVLVTYHQDNVYDSALECGLSFADNADIWREHGLDPQTFTVSDKDLRQPFWLDCRKFTL